MNSFKANESSEMSYFEEQDFEYYDVNSDPEYIEFLEKCEEYNDFSDLNDFYEDNVDMRPLESVLVDAPARLDDDDKYEDEFVSLGKVVSRPEKVEKKPKLKYVKSKTYKKTLTFDSAIKCSKSCPRVEENFGIITGSCFKVHEKETEDNFLIRNQIKSKKSFALTFTSSPPSEFIKDLLTSVKKIGGTKLDVSIINPNESVEDFFKRTKN